MAQYPISADYEMKCFGTLPVTLAAGQSRVVDARGMSQLCVIASAGATATISRVDDPAAGADSADTAGNIAVALGTRVTTAVDWPFWRVTAASGAVRVCAV